MRYTLGLPGDHQQLLEYLMDGRNASESVLDTVQLSLPDEHVKLMNLCHDWLDSLLPFIMAK
eukprot:1107596-Ditylum_brightwellii.AAC.1